MAIMMITHDMGVIAEISDHVVVMYAGQVVERCSIDELFQHPLHPYSAGLLESIPRPGEKFLRGKQPLREIAGQVPDLIRLPPGCLFASRCPLAEERCRKTVPRLIQAGPDHDVRCLMSESSGFHS
jgi:oligopeptide/dipeptide ABC transporter ATP-binding protein